MNKQEGHQCGEPVVHATEDGHAQFLRAAATIKEDLMVRRIAKKGRHDAS